MGVECLDLVDFLLIAEQVTGFRVEELSRHPRLQMAEHALSAPNAGIGPDEYYPRFADKAAAMAFQLIKGHPLLDGNKRVGYACLLEFAYRNGYEWSRPPNDGVERNETVAMIEGVAAGTVNQDQFRDWIQERLVEPEGGSTVFVRS
ncbi:MAG: type II toxin-antitoxin system death-on-curing family toxin [Acidimicrobiaceae bacterium]|nr:type II toxin-antitoxin system death-on-curing family toxin [Acidimicrobiaceae bacterium]MXW75363.1 type II toxin-antitoxin system death-on-curing family toxin [Acidimicrobiaceae bacterium]MYC41732.1 type II toxin-antitoxin system death-on-curing family toxin [Acidimicrobiaceae bacterium]MYD06976.1 type II toxin-antitoxin system death-on-curing family toxin [Acidimicrobiaceae bacterium]MYH89123.1 type II toxin-antitoxin system death-on-curing family toxin [Acidimicrobiaceae bacterium]